MSGSWVTMTMVMPSSRLRLVRRFITSSLVAVSRVAGGLVGQHHLRTGDDGARDGDALLLAAGQHVRIVIGAAGEADHWRSASRARRLALAGGDAAIDERQLDVFHRRGARQEIEALEDEAEESCGEASACWSRSSEPTLAPMNS